MPVSKKDWRIVIVAAVGTLNGVDAAFDNFTRGMLLKGLSALPLICLFAPALMVSRRRWLFRLAEAFCLFEVFGSGLVFLGSLVSVMDPMSFTIRIFTVKVLYLDGVGSQFLYFAARGVAFFIAFLFLVTRREEPNKAPEPTSGIVTPPAEQEVAPIPPVAHL
jgi:hypothetical protein